MLCSRIRLGPSRGREESKVMNILGVVYGKVRLGDLCRLIIGRYQTQAKQSDEKSSQRTAPMQLPMHLSTPPSFLALLSVKT